MPAMRHLPRKHNPLVLPESSPDYEELLARRRLGMTNLSVKPEQINKSNATKAENLGLFEYAHLRAPLPKDLKGSEIFIPNADHKTPHSYFLMRRSRDGYVSATGMFKIAFPWAKGSDEKAEREYLKPLPGTSEDEIAGNVWVSPELALELAQEYRMVDWVRALLDPADIAQNPSTPEKTIHPPPKFELPTSDTRLSSPPAAATRHRTLRSASPTKAPPPGRKILTPRKPSSRLARGNKESSAASSIAANEDLQNSLDDAASTAESVKGKETAAGNGQVNGERANDLSETVKVNVESVIDSTEDGEKERTLISVEMPTGAPELPLPQDPDTMLSKAKEMVDEALKLQEEASHNPSSSKATSKRKADDEAADAAEDGEDSTQRAKRAKVLENTLRRERIRNRALIGVTATLALAATIPYFF